MTTPQKTGTPVLLPSLGENVTEATITRWLKAPGDRVEADEPLLEVATDKVDTEVPSPVAGTILELVVGEDDSVAIDAVIAIIGTEVDSAPVPAPEVAPSDPTPASTPSEVDTDDPAPASAAVERASAEPTAEDAPALPAGHIRMERLPKIRQTIARRMLESLRTSAQLTTVIEADITAIAKLRNAEKGQFAQSRWGS